MYAEMLKKEGVECIPGGSGLNSCRAANFMLKKTAPNSCTYFGCIGKDVYADKIKSYLTDEGVKGEFAISEDTPTGTCSVLVYNKERSLCANLSAALKYPMDHLTANMKIVEEASIVYGAGFFLTSNVDAYMKIGKYCNEVNKPFAVNLSALFLI